jgi:hypothetical protein
MAGGDAAHEFSGGDAVHEFSMAGSEVSHVMLAHDGIRVRWDPVAR